MADGGNTASNAMRVMPAVGAQSFWGMGCTVSRGQGTSSSLKILRDSNAVISSHRASGSRKLARGPATRPREPAEEESDD